MKTLKQILTAIVVAGLLQGTVLAQTNQVEKVERIEPDQVAPECLLAGLVLTTALLGIGITVYVHWKYGEAKHGELAAFVLQRQACPGATWQNVCTNIMVVDTNIPAISIYYEIVRTNHDANVKFRAKCFKTNWPDP